MPTGSVSIASNKCLDVTRLTVTGPSLSTAGGGAVSLTALDEEEVGWSKVQVARWRDSIRGCSPAVMLAQYAEREGRHRGGALHMLK